MPRKATGQLIWRTTGWYARFMSVVDGERIRVCRALDTKNKVVAKAKMDRLLASEEGAAVDAKRPETFSEAAERVYALRREGGAGSVDSDLSSLRRHVFPLIGPMPAPTVKASDVNAVLDHVKGLGLSRDTAAHVRQRISNIFAQLCREDSSLKNPVEDAVMPIYRDATVKERAVLSDAELATYLAWEHPKKRFRLAVLERQTMCCVSRMFGGLRTGDLHALRWESFDVEDGSFAWGYAPRQKTRRPQLLEVPEMLRPFLRDWWTRAGRPTSGVVFPSRKAGRRGDRVGEEKIGVSHAAAFRRDLQRAFKDARELGREAPDATSRRWRELFAETPFTLPVDFHSWRRAYAQALADADVSAQQAIALTGHADMTTHARYLKSAGKMRRLPDAALPRLSAREKALAKGTDKGTAPESPCFPMSQSGDENNGPSDISKITRAAADSGTLRSQRSLVRIQYRVPKTSVESSTCDEGLNRAADEKALTLPNPGKAPATAATTLPAVPSVDLLDLLRAADAAVVAGELARARSLIAAAAAELDAEKAAPVPNRTDKR